MLVSAANKLLINASAGWMMTRKEMIFTEKQSNLPVDMNYVVPHWW